MCRRHHLDGDGITGDIAGSTLDIIEMLIMFCFLANQHWGDPFGARAVLHDRNP